MLTDHRIEQERWAQGMRERRKVAWAYGRFIASLAPWHWFINPLTMRDRGFHGRPEDQGQLRRDDKATVKRWLADHGLLLKGSGGTGKRGRPVAAEALSLSTGTIDTLIARKEWTAIRCGRKDLVRQDSLLAFAKRDHPTRDDASNPAAAR